MTARPLAANQCKNGAPSVKDEAPLHGSTSFVTRQPSAGTDGQPLCGCNGATGVPSGDIRRGAPYPSFGILLGRGGHPVSAGALQPRAPSLCRSAEMVVSSSSHVLSSPYHRTRFPVNHHGRRSRAACRSRHPFRKIRSCPATYSNRNTYRTSVHSATMAADDFPTTWQFSEVAHDA